jgi:hypothetical protein
MDGPIPSHCHIPVAIRYARTSVDRLLIETQGLLDIISSIESHVDGMKSLLNDPESQYKLIDPRFRPIDNTRWLEIVEATGARSVNVRGVELLEDSALSLGFAERKLRASTQGTFVLLGYVLKRSPGTI